MQLENWRRPSTFECWYLNVQTLACSNIGGRSLIGHCQRIGTIICSLFKEGAIKCCKEKITSPSNKWHNIPFLTHHEAKIMFLQLLKKYFMFCFEIWDLFGLEKVHVFRCLSKSFTFYYLSLSPFIYLHLLPFLPHSLPHCLSVRLQPFSMSTCPSVCLSLSPNQVVGLSQLVRVGELPVLKRKGCEREKAFPSQVYIE